MPATKETLLRLARRATRHRNDIPPEDRLLADWRELDAYVLLGDPGAGKSFAFEDESKACDVALITARNFITLGIEPSHKGKTLFIDALDEMRAGGGDGRAPLDAIRARLNELGRPRFRLSYREADWRSQADVNALRDVAPKGEVTELHLEPLTRAEVFEVLRSRPVQVPDPDAFWRRGETHGLTALFGNPLLLDLTIHAVASGWPDSRQGVYEQACRRLAEETSIEHLAAKPLAPGDIDKLLDDAGLLCALLLLSGRRAVARRASEDTQLVALPALPADLQFHDAAVALASKVFITQAGISTPRHR